ncbi:tetratricopeptide repeat protein [Peribacillus tepidiphilus]|uniref:tetratricopeptide repeat protein n=1 Tax=Peribacillus tepidiphilus TaxID=2652445 RepID=UPI0035B511A5
MKVNSLSNFRERPVIWVQGMKDDTSLVLDDKCSIIINFSVDDRSFKPYYTIGEIIKKMETTFKEYKKMDIITESYNTLMNSWKRMDMSSDSIIYSIIRRISRESSATTKLIDQLAEKIVDMVNEIFTNEGRSLTVVLNASEWIDRPSLRVLHRIFKHLPSPKLKLVLGFTGNIPSKFELKEPFNMLESVLVARSRIFKRLLAEQNPLITGEKFNECDFSEYNFDGTENGLISDAAIALITQNYENAFLACEKVLKNESMHTEEIYRIIGLVHANLSLYDEAYAAFQKALDFVDNGPQRAHVECLAALLAVKRFYNLDVARTHYDNALTFVDESDNRNRLEKGWIYNGLSFMDTVASSKLEGDEKNRLLDDVLQRELKALDLIKNQQDSGSLYLKYNLLSNITFLLEIRKDYISALEFWKSAFYKLIGDEHGYCYRTGMLAWKAGKINEAINCLEKAYQTALHQKDRLDTESILYALGYVNLDIGKHEESIKYFRKGLEISLILRNTEQIEDFARGFIQASSIMDMVNENLAVLQNICEKFKDILPNKVADLFITGTPLEEQSILEKRLRQPKTKLSSYHPSVDLEAVPEIDMNEYLISNTNESDTKIISKILTRS